MKRTLLLSAVLLALAGCSTEEPAATTDNCSGDNVAPTLTVNTSNASINEGESFTFTFNALDCTKYEELKISLLQENTVGQFTLNKASKTVSYKAPILGGAQSLITDGAVLQITDAGGLKVERTLQVSVSDIDSQVDLTILPPANSFGYENTQTAKQLNLFIYEGSDVSLRIAIDEDEKDADDIDVSFSLDREGLLFANNITRSINESGTEAALSFKIPQISQASEQVVISFSAADNDGQDEVTASITVVNQPSLAWSSNGTSSRFTESAGGEIGFTFSELVGYPGQFSIEATTEDGSDLPFTLPVQVDGVNRKIVIGSAGRMLGNTNVKLSLSHTFIVTNASGETFDVVTRAERVITLQDDRDDDFSDSTAKFNEASLQLKNILNRQEEILAFDALSKLLMLDNRVSKQNMKAGKLLVETETAAQKTRFTQMENEIKALISSGEKDEANRLISDYLSDVDRVGSSVRTKISEWATDNVVPEVSGNTPLTLSWSSSALNKTGDSWSHYVGNLTYGFYDTVTGDWQYKAGYTYLGAIDTDNNICE